ncbi:MAG: four helix bundle protein [Ruminococcaceae bacterium]|nr:four helix bundle protein [Oscillospiraceae bacterium]
MDFAVSIIELVKSLKEKRESIISNQIGRSGTSIGASIRVMLISSTLCWQSLRVACTSPIWIGFATNAPYRSPPACQRIISIL